MLERNKKSKKKINPKVSLEVEIARTILKGGNYISASGERIDLYNSPRSYSEARRRGYNFYIYEES